MEQPNPQESLDDYLATVAIWKELLNNYSKEELERKPSEDSWSLAQVYRHWLDASQYYMLAKIRICWDHPKKHQDGELSELGIKLLSTNEFPVQEVKIPAKTEDQPENNGSIAIFRQRIQRLTEDVERVNLVLEGNPRSGKSGHRFFGFMNDHQWYRLIPIHMRHHFRQQKKLDIFLGKG
jgi:hypothetical protein